MVKMSSSFFFGVPVVLVLFVISIIESMDFYEGRIIQDITKLVNNDKLTGENLKLAVDSFLKYNNDIGNSGPVLIYYESDFHYGVSSVEKALNRISSVMLDKKLLINIIDRIFIPYNADLRKIVEIKYSDLLYKVSQHASIINGLSFELYDVENVCNFKSSNSQVRPNNTTIIHEIQSRLRNDVLKIGYVLNFRNLNCPAHKNYKKDADYIIVDYTLRRNDNVFTESYGAFKDIIRNVKADVINSLHTTSKTVFHRMRIDTNIVVDNAKNKYCPGKGYVKSHAKELVDLASRMLDKMESDYMSRYEHLLLDFCRQWLTDESDVLIILKYTRGVNKPNISADRVIPQIPKYPNLDKTEIRSFSFLLEEIAMSGFSTIMIDGGTWQELTSKGITNFNCNNRTCRPQNVLYLNDINYSFSWQGHNKIPIEKWLSVGGVNLSGLVFSRRYKESKNLNWHKGIERLQNTAKSIRGNSARIETGCTEWEDIFDVLNTGTYDTVCDALELLRVFGCYSLNGTSNIKVWRGELNIKDNNATSFTENIMRKLDAVILGRQILQNRYGTDKRVFLQFKVTYEGESSGVTNSVYCTNWIEKMSRLYEILLTWAEIHDFTVIIEPIDDEITYYNPISWQRLQTTVPGQMYNLMELFPVFIRRNYNQSRVFASWTNGMYPCIDKSTNKKDMEIFNFHNKYAGTTISLNIHDDTHFISSRELETILLLTLKKFVSVEVILRSRSELQILYNSVLRGRFEENLKINNIPRRNIYLTLPTNMSISDSGKAIEIAFELAAYGFNVNIHYPSSSSFGNEYDLFLNHTKISVGLLLENCTDNTMKILTSNFLSNINLSRLDYMICETNFLPAHNNDDVIMQNALNSHLYLKKLFQYFFPNLKEIHFRLHPILHGNTFDSQSRNLLLFLADVNNYAKTHEIHYFLLPALSPRNKKSEPSFWTLKDHQTMENVSSFEKRQATFLNVTSWTPRVVKETENRRVRSSAMPVTEVTTTTSLSNTMSSTKHFSTANVDKNISKLPNKHETQSSKTDESTLHTNLWSTYNLYILIGGCSLTFFVLLLITLKILKTHRYLTAKEVTDFFKGRRETLQEASVRRKRETNNGFNVFDGLVHQKDHEISKNTIKLNTETAFNYDGNFSKIYKGKMPESEEHILVEICNKRILKTYFMAMLSEVKMQCYLENHFNIVRFIGCYTREIRKGVLWIATEFCEGGSLERHISQFKSNISLHDMVKFAKEIASGMDYLSSQDVIHGDLRTKNVFLSQPNKVCKIGKFGLPRKLLRYQEFVKKCKHDLLPWRWMSVESLESLEFSTYSDVWSFGITIWEIFTLGMTPNDEIAVLKDTEVTKFIDQLKDGKILACPSHATSEIYQIMTQCWKLEPQCRPDFATITEFFSDKISQVIIDK